MNYEIFTLDNIFYIQFGKIRFKKLFKSTQVIGHTVRKGRNGFSVILWSVDVGVGVWLCRVRHPAIPGDAFRGSAHGAERMSRLKKG